MPPRRPSRWSWNEAIILYICCGTCSQATKERTNEARAMAISLDPRRRQEPLETSARASRGTSRRRVTKPRNVRTKARSKRTSTLRETGAEGSQEGNASKKTPKVWPRTRSSWRDRRVRRLGGRRGKNDAGDSRTTETYRTVKVVTTVERHLHNLCVLIEDGEFCTWSRVSRFVMALHASACAVLWFDESSPRLQQESATNVFHCRPNQK